MVEDDNWVEIPLNAVAPSHLFKGDSPRAIKEDLIIPGSGLTRSETLGPEEMGGAVLISQQKFVQRR